MIRAFNVSLGRLYHGNCTIQITYASAPIWVSRSGFVVVSQLSGGEGSFPSSISHTRAHLCRSLLWWGYIPIITACSTSDIHSRKPFNSFEFVGCRYEVSPIRAKPHGRRRVARRWRGKSGLNRRCCVQKIHNLCLFSMVGHRDHGYPTQAATRLSTLISKTWYITIHFRTRTATTLMTTTSPSLIPSMGQGGLSPSVLPAIKETFACYTIGVLLSTACVPLSLYLPLLEHVSLT